MGLDWSDIVTGLGVAAVIEGILYAVFPNGARDAMMQFFALPEDQRRKGGLAIAVFGVFLIWMARG